MRRGPIALSCQECMRALRGPAAHNQPRPPAICRPKHGGNLSLARAPRKSRVQSSRTRQHAEKWGVFFLGGGRCGVTRFVDNGTIPKSDNAVCMIERPGPGRIQVLSRCCYLSLKRFADSSSVRKTPFPIHRHLLAACVRGLLHFYRDG